MSRTQGTDPFLTPERYADDWARRMEPPRGKLLVASCRGGSYLAEKVVRRYRELASESGSASEVAYLENVDSSFADGETRVRLASHVGGADVFLVQVPYDPTGARTVDHNVLAFLIAARAFRESGARHVTGVLPYLPFARQDKPTKFRREPTTARLVADLCVAAGIDRALTWEPHCGQVRGFFGIVPVTILESVSLFVQEFRSSAGAADVIVVAPDVGASKLVTHFGRALDLRCAIASKFRESSGEASITEIIGDFSGKRTAIVLDDMISSAATLRALVEKLVLERGIGDVRIAVSHNLCVGRARERLAEMVERYPVRRIVVTDSVPQLDSFTSLRGVEVRSLADPLARVINRIHYEQSVSEAFFRPAEAE